MCGIHDSSGAPIGHHHDELAGKPIFRPRLRRAPGVRSRRTFLGDLGKGAMAVAVVSPVLVACSSDDDATPSEGTGDEASGTTAAPAEGDDAASTTTGSGDGAGGDGATEELRWARTELDFVSAYVLARGNTAAIVDTGTSGSADAIGETLQTLGLTYDDVDHVILTHHHADHVGSINEVVARASSAMVYAGEADLNRFEVRGADVTALVGGEDIFGFESVPTPGHTPGHMAVIDREAGVFVAGDAIFTQDGGVVEGPERFFADVPQSRESIKAIAALSFNTMLVGHGDPIEEAADTAVAALAATL